MTSRLENLGTTLGEAYFPEFVDAIRSQFLVDVEDFCEVCDETVHKHVNSGYRLKVCSINCAEASRSCSG